MPRRLRDPTDPRSWLSRARSNLARARARPASEDVLYEDLCFDAQQCAEKALKGFLLARGADVPKTHSIGQLLASLERHGAVVPDPVRGAVRLTDYAVQARYPGAVEPVEEEEWAEAVALAGRVFTWVEKSLTAK